MFPRQLRPCRCRVLYACLLSVLLVWCGFLVFDFLFPESEFVSNGENGANENDGNKLEHPGPPIKSELLPAKDGANEKGRKNLEHPRPPIEPELLPEYDANGDPKIVNPHDFKYIHNVPKVCSDKTVELVMAVPGRTNSFKSRKAIRETWGAYSKDPKHHALLLFFLGATDDANVQKEIDNEANQYGDIIQEDFVDSYRNLSLKSISLMRWISEFCPTATFMLKADDDMYINVPNLISTLRHAQIKNGPVFIIGYVQKGVTPIRGGKSKYIISKQEYFANSFPRYCSGTSYALTSQAAKKLYKESGYIPPFVFEDVYLTGIVAENANVTRVHDYGFTKIRNMDGCGYRKRINGFHGNSADDIRRIHKEVNDPNFNCTAKPK